jgi:hypothetical protein
VILWLSVPKVPDVLGLEVNPVPVPDAPVQLGGRSWGTGTVTHRRCCQNCTLPAYAIEKLKVRLIEKDSKQLLGEGVTDEGGQAQVTLRLRSGVLYPVAARIEVSNDVETLLISSIPQQGVWGLYPSDIWVVRLPAKTMDR